MKKDVLNDMEIEDLLSVDNLAERALDFAIIAHKGQVRKNDVTTPMVMHPINVANILKKYGADRYVIAAAYLHDVVEDTKYTLDDIDKYCGVEVRELVRVATESDKSLSWEERKQHTIDSVKYLTLRKKLVIIADKINNIEDLEKSFSKKGYRDFSAFKRGEEQQEWYYRNVYESLIYGEDKTNPLFERLERGINLAFGRSMEEYFKENEKVLKY